jgi:diguanylate cyclase (GGDEF)-like protein
VTTPFVPLTDAEKRLAEFVDRVSDTLIRAAAGDFTAQVERDFAGDPADVLAYLVNSTIAELRVRIETTERRAEEDRSRLEALVRERTRELDRLATTDLLTETFNRRRLKEIAGHELSRARRFNQPLCVAMLDLDHFKTINDTFGHSVGDIALQMAAAAIRSRVRSHDHVGRYGGEEFVVVLPGTAQGGAIRLAESVRDAIATVVLETETGPVTLTTSAGVAEWDGAETLDEVLARADAALYRAKEAGRNCVVAAPPTPAAPSDGEPAAGPTAD